MDLLYIMNIFCCGFHVKYQLYMEWWSIYIQWYIYIYRYRESRNCFSYCGQDLIYSMNMPACMRWVMFYVLWDSIGKHCLPNDSLIKKLKWKQGKERERTWSKTFFWFFLLQRGQKLSLTLKLDPSQTLQTFIFLFMIVRIVHELLQLHFDAIGFTQKSLRGLA